ncbi:hypothetical protein QE152_g4 [Popillia japonica]|uniref:Uncharacterized protein n=1 Tax=Popillia japonica TaxID=7064 RepID=A0AAW1NKY7_POPJA
MPDQLEPTSRRKMGKRKERVDFSDYPSSLEDDNFSLASSGRSMELFGSLENLRNFESQMDESIASTSSIRSSIAATKFKGILKVKWTNLLHQLVPSDRALQQQNLSDIVQQIKSRDYVVVVYM